MNKANSIDRQGSHRALLLLRWVCAICFAIITVAASYFYLAGDRQPPHPSTLAELLARSPQSIAQVPVAELNLLCAKNLHLGSEPDIHSCNAALDEWAARVRSETERHRYRFKQNPAEYENSSGFFHMLMLCVVLAEDYNVHYDEQRRVSPAETRPDDNFFADPASVFLHGLLGPERRGTCSSLPVLYVAVGRRLGYPLELVTTRGHLFVRWDGLGERFNVEATSQGLSRFDDDYYRRWPFQISPQEEASEGYLKSLTPSEELAVFLSIRGMCLRYQGRMPEAIESFAAAAKLAPGCQGYQTMHATLKAAVAQSNNTSPKESQTEL